MEPIKPYDLIPIISYVILGGKCRNCKQQISIRYPLIELLTALSFTLVFYRYGFSYFSLIGMLLTSSLIIVGMIDIDTMEIYDRFQIFILILALANLFITPLPFLDHLMGFFIISVPFYIIAYITGGIGGGDIKLIAIAGLLLGYKATLVAFFIASIIGGSVAIYLLLTKQKDRKSLIAFGPYLCIGIYFAYLYGNELLSWYLNFYQ
jgi:leader peptidase (prepilin peptidase)/N-methyltransferase